MEDNEDDRTPSAMVNGDDRSTRSTKMEFVEGRRLQVHEGLKAWQGLYLRNKQEISLLRSSKSFRYCTTR